MVVRDSRTGPRPYTDVRGGQGPWRVGNTLGSPVQLDHPFQTNRVIVAMGGVKAPGGPVFGGPARDRLAFDETWTLD